MREGKPRSIWVCALHKTASTFLYKYCRFVATHLDPPWPLYSNNNTPPNKSAAGAETGSYIVAPVRQFHVPAWAAKRHLPTVIVQLRDPRDTHVSEYFQVGYTRKEVGIPEAAMVARRHIRAGRLPIDDFVKESAVRGGPLFDNKPLKQRLIDDLERLMAVAERCQFQVHTVRYEDMVLDFRSWNQNILRAMGFEELIPLAQAEFAGLFDVQAIENRGEKMVHRRKVIPGDHRQKLQPETICFLNELFGPALKPFGYSL